MASELASMFPKLGSLGTSDHGSVVSINLFVALLCACIVIGHLLEENRWINESITALIIVSVTPFVLRRGFHGKTHNADGEKISNVEVSVSPLNVFFLPFFLSFVIFPSSLFLSFLLFQFFEWGSEM